MGKDAYKGRVLRVVRTQRAQRAAAKMADGLRRACRSVLKHKGAGVKGWPLALEGALAFASQ